MREFLPTNPHTHSHTNPFTHSLSNPLFPAGSSQFQGLQNAQQPAGNYVYSLFRADFQTTEAAYTFIPVNGTPFTRFPAESDGIRRTDGRTASAAAASAGV